MHAFLNRIKSFVDELAGIGSPVSLNDYVDAILEGLSPDYVTVILVIKSKFETLPIT